MVRKAATTPREKRKSPRTPAFREFLVDVQTRVDRELLSFTKAELARVATIERDLVPMVESVHSLCARGGKRLRPALLEIGALTGEQPVSKKTLVRLGVSLELLQAYFLIHDDWMDRDDERRGGPTAHVALAKVFKNAHVGACSAILAGDFALAKATEVFGSSGLLPEQFGPALRCFAEMQSSAVLGQQLDIVGKTKDPELTYALKTASYTVKGPLRLGALTSGATSSCLRALDAFSAPSGIAFQLRDDLIGVYGDPKKTGKPKGADLTAGKNTVLTALGLSRAKKHKDVLLRVLGNSAAKPTEIEAAMNLLDELGARRLVEERIALLMGEAEKALGSKAIPEAPRTLLSEALVALCQRES